MWFHVHAPESPHDALVQGAAYVIKAANVRPRHVRYMAVGGCLRRTCHRVSTSAAWGAGRLGDRNTYCTQACAGEVLPDQAGGVLPGGIPGQANALANVSKRHALRQLNDVICVWWCHLHAVA
jgi:hypothetical protein